MGMFWRYIQRFAGTILKNLFVHTHIIQGEGNHGMIGQWLSGTIPNLPPLRMYLVSYYYSTVFRDMMKYGPLSIVVGTTLTGRVCSSLQELFPVTSFVSNPVPPTVASPPWKGLPLTGVRKFNDNYKHLRDAFIDPDQDLQCTDEDESLFLFDSESSGTPMDIEDIIPSDEDMFCVSEGESTGNNIPSNK